MYFWTGRSYFLSFKGIIFLVFRNTLLAMPYLFDCIIISYMKQVSYDVITSPAETG